LGLELYEFYKSSARNYASLDSLLMIMLIYNGALI